MSSKPTYSYKYSLKGLHPDIVVLLAGRKYKREKTINPGGPNTLVTYDFEDGSSESYVFSDEVKKWILWQT